MMIRDFFADDINRKIDGVIKVDQAADDVIEQELNEYVITKELKKHFITFFNYYDDSFEQPTADIGVWISGFFGSGKSHFLKMLSYLLENTEVKGVRCVERFRKKFEDDPATFMLIDRATKGQTETILFNIDIEGFSNKDKTAVLRVFAKMFYNHQGFYGENLKVAMMERYIDQQGKTEEFRRVFEEKKGKSWLEMRRAFAFNGKFIIPTMMEVLDMSEDDAKAWFNDKTTTEISIAQLVEDIKAYVDTKPADFRLLFMIDEVGQYVGTDTNMLLNLQSLVEKIGSECGGKVWVVCTGQEAIDEIIKVRENEFSRIQARFKTRLSLTSSSVDEVIQKRILKKKTEVEPMLEQLYNQNDSVMRNLFSFTDALLDIKGYTGPQDFTRNFPFLPYQFIVLQKVFVEIRKHGNAGTHHSGAERSMLSGFQEVAQKIQEQDEYALAPFYLFYDTVHTFLDSSIRRVIERCQKAADNGDGIEQQDVDVLKLLYLIRYVDDIPANLDNIIILMADDIRLDKIKMREKIRGSLDRLLSQNYIGRTGNTYNFLTDEEQDIQREIYKNTPVDTSEIITRIGEIIFSDIYGMKNYRYKNNDFQFMRMVDNKIIGTTTAEMQLRIMTVAADDTEKDEFYLRSESQKKQAIVVLSETPYFESLEKALKVRNYMKKHGGIKLPQSTQDIIRTHLDEAAKCESSAKEDLKKAIIGAEFYVDGERIEIKGGDAKGKQDQALEYLVTHVYSEHGLIGKHAETDADILAVLNGVGFGSVENHDAAVKMEEYIEMQDRNKLPTSMADIQSRYRASPYGWKQIDIALVVAMLIYDQKVTIKYAGETIQPSNPKLPDMLRKLDETNKTIIAKRQSVDTKKMKAVKGLLRDYFEIMDVPDDEDGLVALIVKKFSEEKLHYEELMKKYTSGRNYPDKDKVACAIELMKGILSQQKDNTALIDKLLKEEDNLFDNKDNMQRVEEFFKKQVQIFDAAAQLVDDLSNELDYLSHEPEANQALNQIRLITVVQGGFNYAKVPELNTLMATVHEGHDRLLEAKRKELLEIVVQCMAAIHQAADKDFYQTRDISDRADIYYSQKKENIRELKSLALLDGLVPQMLQYKDNACSTIEELLIPREPKPEVEPKPANGGVTTHPQPKKIIKDFQRGIVFPAKKLESEDEIDAYVEQIRTQLKTLLKGCDGIQLK